MDEQKDEWKDRQIDWRTDQQTGRWGANEQTEKQIDD